MNAPRSHNTSDLAETWEQFKSSRGRELQNWVEAERALYQARRAGGGESAPGDRLLAAEAALQSAIVDFAAAQNGAADPTPVALGLLRLAEHVLEEGTGTGRANLGQEHQDRQGLEERRHDRRSGGDRRRRLRPQN